MFHRTLARIVPVALVALLITLGPVTATQAEPAPQQPVATHRDSISIPDVDATALEPGPTAHPPPVASATRSWP